MGKVKDALFLLIGLIVVVGSFYFVFQKPAPSAVGLWARPARYQSLEGDISYVVVGEQRIEVEIAETEEERQQGLSGRESLEPDHGMLFIFEKPGIYGFWMPDMLFSIDIVWIAEDWTVAGVERGIEPGSYPAVFRSNAPIRYVLEIPAGRAQAYSIDTGSKVFLDR